MARLSRNESFVGIGILLLLVSVGFALTPTKIEATDTEITRTQDLLLRRNQPFSGIFIERFQNGQLYRETRYENGLRNGYYRQYALDGHMVELGNYHAGLKEGLQQGWYAEGPKRFHFHFVKGLFEGVQTQWHLNGEVFREEVFAAGRLVDKKILFSDGKVFTNYRQRDNRIYGLDGGALCMESKANGSK